jgi:hypothetical protein
LARGVETPEEEWSAAGVEGTCASAGGGGDAGGDVVGGDVGGDIGASAATD